MKRSSQPFAKNKLLEQEISYYDLFSNKISTGYGKIYYNPLNPSSWDSNHAHILDIDENIEAAINDIIRTSFTDDGPGIPPEIINRIFDPFFTTKDIGKETGLGLSICYGIVTKQGGRIYAVSQHGHGATFIIEIPLKRDAL
ncbi:MAG: sensor histidine kinase [Dehalococcoidales bacterium]